MMSQVRKAHCSKWNAKKNRKNPPEPIVSCSCSATLHIGSCTMPCHGLLPTRARNNWLGRILAIFLAFHFEQCALRTCDIIVTTAARGGAKKYTIPKTQSRAAAYSLHYMRIAFGLYLGELAISFMCWLPRSVLRPRLRALCPDLEDGTRGMAHLVDSEL